MPIADPLLITLGFAAAANLVLLLVVVRMRGLRLGIINENTIQLLLLIYALGSLAWTVVQGLERAQTLRVVVGFDLYALARIALYILLGLAVIFFQLTRVFQRRADPGWLGWAGGSLILAVAALLYENPLHLPDTLGAAPVGGYIILRWLAAYAVIVLGWGIFLGSAVVLTFLNYRQMVSPLHRNRIKYWSIVVSAAITGNVLILARLPLPGSLLLLIAQGVMVYTLITHNLPDLRMAMRRLSSYLIMLLLTVAAYTGGFYGIEWLFKNTPGYNPLLAGAVLALVLAVLFNPLLGAVQRFVSQVMVGVRYDSHQTLSEYSMSISNILDMDLLATIVVGLISEAMEITYGALVTVHYENDDALNPDLSGEDKTPTGRGEGYLLRSISGLGHEMPEGRISANSPVAYYLRREHRPLLQYDIDLQPRFHVMEPAEREWLAGLGMDVYVPIYTKESWIGLLALGPKTSGDRYYPEDLILLQTLADQTAVALENARLYRDLKLRNIENERLNSELKKANVELARLDHAKSDFINIASHELRTPLTQVIGYNDILGDMVKSSEMEPAVAAQMIDSVRRAARRLEDIVETMFDVSKLDTNTLDLMQAPVSLSAVITTAIDTWKKGLDERKQTVLVRGLGNLPTIVADGKRLAQVFSHLIQNAIKSTPDGGQVRISGRVVVSTDAPGAETIELAPVTGMNGEEMDRTRPGSNGAALAGENGSGISSSGFGERYIEIVVADTGIGIAADELERIFEKFYRVGNVLLHSTGDTKFKGAGPGLGLTIARGIIEAHGGRIWAESPGYDEEHCPGAKFHVLLPIRTTLPKSLDLDEEIRMHNRR